MRRADWKALIAPGAAAAGEIARAGAIGQPASYSDKMISMQIEIYDKPAELRLIQACREGDATIISLKRPEEGSADNTIRAGLIRALLLSTGDCKPPAYGLLIFGAWITGKLDLEGEALPVPLVLIHCTLEEDVILRDCTLPALYMPGTHLPKLDAQGLQCRGDLHLRGGFQAIGLVDLVGATITGQLACTGGKFLAKGMALNCSAISVGADVFLRTGFEARGWVDLKRAEIAGNLQMSAATLNTGLDAKGVRVRAGFIWKDVTGDGIEVDLIDAHVGTLVDSPGSWQSVKMLRLSSFRYDRIESDMDVQERLDWLAKHDATARRFTPQPYVQLANVLRRQGFAGDAARVLVRREDKQRRQEYLDGQAAHKQSRDHLNGDLRPAAASLWADGKFALNVLKRAAGYLFGLMFGYGHQPARVLPWIAAILGITICFAQQIHIHGQFAPTSSVVLTSQDWLDSFPTDPVPDSPLWRVQLDAWAQTTSGRDYTSFSAFLYALDLFIPLDALGQEKNWAPSAERGWWGDLGHRLRWLVQMAGWVITAIGAAVLTGLIGRRD
jgi:hypothetical protein